MNNLQEIISANNNKSSTTVGGMRTIVEQMWQYALTNELVTSNITDGLIFECTNPDKQIHTRFTDKEIELL